MRRRIVALFMQPVLTNYCANQATTVIDNNARTVRRMSWLRVKKLNLTGQQEETT